MSWGAISALTGVIGIAFAAGMWVKASEFNSEDNAEIIKELKKRISINERKMLELNIPKGAVLAFDLPDGCPKDGWEPLTDVDGRFIIGSSTKFKYRESGGQESYTLSVSNLPNLSVTLSEGNHARLVDASRFDQSGGNSPVVNSKGTRHPYASNINFNIGNTGAVTKYNIMPPYLPLHFCKKT